MARNAADMAREKFDEMASPKPPAGFERRSFAIPLQREGDVLAGVYDGPGAVKVIEKKVKGKLTKSKVPTFVVKTAEGARVLLLATSQLETFFETCKAGDEVWIQRGKTIEAGAYGRVTQYETYAKPKGSK